MEVKTGFIASSFDIMHPGYVLMLKECKDNCNYLVAALHENPVWEREDKNTPIMSLHERFLILKSIRYIDEIAPYRHEGELINLLKFYKPDIRFLGSDYNTPEMKKKIILKAENVIDIMLDKIDVVDAIMISDITDKDLEVTNNNIKKRRKENK